MQLHKLKQKNILQNFHTIGGLSNLYDWLILLQTLSSYSAKTKYNKFEWYKKKTKELKFTLESTQRSPVLWFDALQ